MSEYPNNLKYTKEHEWVSLEGNIATVGITEYAAEQLGDVVHIDLPEMEREVDKGAAFGVVESVKSVSDIYTPLTGKVVEINEALGENSGLINEDPYGEGWIVKVEASQLSEVEGLLSAQAYQAFLSEEA